MTGREKLDVKNIKAESKKNQPKQVWQIVESIYGPNSWKRMAPKLAAKFGIEKYDRSEKQNIFIAQKLLSGERLESKTALEKMNQFPTEKQKLLRENTDKINEQYLANLTSENIKKLNAIDDPSKFIGFFRNQKDKIVARNRQLNDQTETFNIIDGKDKHINNAVLTIELVEFDNRLDAFLSRAESDGYLKKAEVNAQAEANSRTKINTLSDVEIEANGGKEAMVKKLQRVEVMNILHEKGLDQKYGSEFDELAVSLYNIHKNESWLQKFWNKELLEYVRNKVISMFDRSINAPKDALDATKSIIIREPVMQEYIKDESTNLKSLVKDEGQKDSKYKESLKQKYSPTLKRRIDGVYQSNMISEKDRELFDENTGTLKNNVSDTDKKRFSSGALEKIQTDLKKKFETAESDLLAERNPAIKTQAVSTCIDALRSCMNFSIDNADKENLLVSLQIEKSNATKESDGDRVIELKGKVENKDLTVYYNLSEGTIATQKFLKKDIAAGTYYVDDAEKGREEVPLLQLPKLSDFTEKAASRGDEGRKELLLQGEDIEDMKKNIQKKLDTDVKADRMPDIDPSYFEKVIVQNMFSQELMMDFMKFPKEQSSEIGSRAPEYFQLCELVNNAANRYTNDELRKGREVVKELKDTKEKRITYRPDLKDTDTIKNMQKNNPERYMFEIAFCPYVVDKVNYRTVPENNTCLKFFSCFKSPKSDTFPMIDLDMLGDYTSKLSKKINREEDNTMARKRANTPFEKNMQETENYIETMAMEDSFKA